MTGIQDLHPDEFRRLLYKTADIICDLFTNIGDKRVYHSKGYEDIRALFSEDLPQKPASIDSMLSKIEMCFRYTGKSAGHSDEMLNQLNKRIVKTSEAEGRIFIRETTLKGAIVLRACCTNFRREKTDVEHLLKELRAIGERLVNPAV